MGSYINYWEVKDNVALEYRGNSAYIFSFIGGHWDMREIRNKAKELLEKCKCDGILYRVMHYNVHGKSTNCYFVYYDGNGFHKQGYIDKLGLVFEPFVVDGEEIVSSLPVGC
jgi:hypothetical protein